MTGLIAILRALGVPGIAALRAAGIEALKAALREALQKQAAPIVTKALARLEKDGDVQKLSTLGPYVDLDGLSMTGNEIFAHNAVWALLRAILSFDGGGRLADLIRDDFCAKHLASSGAALAGITDGRAATERVLGLMVAAI